MLPRIKKETEFSASQREAIAHLVSRGFFSIQASEQGVWIVDNFTMQIVVDITKHPKKKKTRGAT